MGGFVAQVGFDCVVCLPSPPQVGGGMERLERQPRQKVAGVEHAGHWAQAPPGSGTQSRVHVSQLGNGVPREAEGGGRGIELGAGEGRVQTGQRVEDGRPGGQLGGCVVDAGGGARRREWLRRGRPGRLGGPCSRRRGIPVFGERGVCVGFCFCTCPRGDRATTGARLGVCFQSLPPLSPLSLSTHPTHRVVRRQLCAIPQHVGVVDVGQGGGQRVGCGRWGRGHWVVGACVKRVSQPPRCVLHRPAISACVCDDVV